jgi:hypothetical protein
MVLLRSAEQASTEGCSATFYKRERGRDREMVGMHSP